MPGIGKTATTLEVIESMLEEGHDFSFLHINAMQITNPNLVYTIICESITGHRLNPTSAALFLDNFFKKKDRANLLLSLTRSRNEAELKKVKAEASKIRVILIDELDALVTSKQTLLYNLFDWPCHQNSRLLVISIANTMDLPERLQEKIKSFIGKNRLVYDPYNKEQIL
jgi:origin recognition complex subunit 1